MPLETSEYVASPGPLAVYKDPHPENRSPRSSGFFLYRIYPISGAPNNDALSRAWFLLISLAYMACDGCFILGLGHRASINNGLHPEY